MQLFRLMDSHGTLCPNIFNQNLTKMERSFISVEYVKNHSASGHISGHKYQHPLISTKGMNLDGLVVIQEPTSTDLYESDDIRES